jgi:hypothetical protein
MKARILSIIASRQPPRNVEQYRANVNSAGSLAKQKLRKMAVDGAIGGRLVRAPKLYAMDVGAEEQLIERN